MLGDLIVEHKHGYFGLLEIQLDALAGFEGEREDEKTGLVVVLVILDDTNLGLNGGLVHIFLIVELFKNLKVVAHSFQGFYWLHVLMLNSSFVKDPNEGQLKRFKPLGLREKFLHLGKYGLNILRLLVLLDSVEKTLDFIAVHLSMEGKTLLPLKVLSFFVRVIGRGLVSHIFAKQGRVHSVIESLEFPHY